MQKNIMRSGTFYIILCLIFCFGCKNQGHFKLYVSPDGDDRNSGTIEAPLATLHAALFKTEEIIDSGIGSEIDIFFREGTYQFEETAVLSGEKFGSGNKITIQAYPDERPVFTAGEILSGWRRLQESPDNLPEICKGNVWVLDLSKMDNTVPAFKVLFDNDIPVYAAISEGFQTDEPDETATDSSLFYFPPGSLKNWTNLKDIEVVLRPGRSWVLNILPLRSVNTAQGTAEVTIPATYKIERMKWIHTEESNLWVSNALEYLDEPGEWVLNTPENRVYYWPVNNREPGVTVIPKLQELVRVEGDEEKGAPLRNIHFRGIEFAHGERDTWASGDIGLQHDWALYAKSDALLRFIDSEDCSVKACVFRSSGSGGLRFDFMSINNTVADCKFYHLGGTALLFSGYGPGLKDLNKENLIISNEIFDCGQAYTHSPGIFIWQSGYNRIAHNLVYDQPNSGIVVSGPRPSFFNKRKAGIREIIGSVRFDEIGEIFEWDEMFPYLFSTHNIIEYNEIFNVVTTISDGNAIYLSGTGYNTVVRRNYLHHNLSPGLHGIIRGDDMTKYAEIYENIIYKFSNSGIVIKHPNIVRNNYIIDCNRVYTEIGVEVPKSEYILIAPLGPIRGSEIKNNICLHLDGKARIIKGVFNPNRFPSGSVPSLTDCSIDSNIYYSKTDVGFQEQLSELKSLGLDQASLFADPLFAGFEDEGFLLKQNSPASRLGIKQIPFEKIGLIEK